MTLPTNFIPVKKRFCPAASHLFVLLTFLLTFTNCQTSPYPQGTLYQLSSQPLSQIDPDLRTCVFDPAFSIVHFPMYHIPPKEEERRKEYFYERAVRSQFQLAHTILDYTRFPSLYLSVFDEHITTDTYNSQYFQNLSLGLLPSATYKRHTARNVVIEFRLEEEMRKAQHLFPNGVIPRNYEHLNPLQKDFIFNLGASLTLYLLGKIPKIHKVISPEKFELARDQALTGASGEFQRTSQSSYWIDDFREEGLKEQVLNLFHNNPNPQRLILIAYGAGHDLSNEFAGYPFQSGHSFCLKWENKFQLSYPTLVFHFSYRFLFL